jgi:Na+/H+ antiporter NhaC
MGAAYSVIFVALLYLPRKIVTPKEFVDGLVQGFINMVPSTLILTFAWTLSGICGADYLNAGGFVVAIVNKYSISMNLMPAIFFVVALVLAFSTGTSWGTFAILLPITVSVFGDSLVPLTAITTAAVLGGSVCGDHISPISDTTILSSTGAGCNHINHVSTQMQYGIVVAIMSAISYIVSGITENTVAGFIAGFVILIVFVLILKLKQKDNEQGIVVRMTKLN